MTTTKTHNTAGHLGWHNHHSTAFQQSLRTIAGPFTLTHSDTYIRTSQLHKQWGWSTSTQQTTPQPGWTGVKKEIPPPLSLSFFLSHTQRGKKGVEGGVGVLQSAGIWHEQTLTKPSGPQRWRKSEGEGGGGGGVCRMPFSSRQPVEQGAQGEKENKTNEGRASISSSPSSSSMWRSVCSTGRSATAGSSGTAAPLQISQPRVICSDAVRIQIGFMQPQKTLFITHCNIYHSNWQDTSE